MVSADDRWVEALPGRWVELTSETLAWYVGPNSPAPLSTVPAWSMHSCDLKQFKVTVHTEGAGSTEGGTPAAGRRAMMRAGSAAQAAEWAHELRSVQLESQLARLTPTRQWTSTPTGRADVVKAVKAVIEQSGATQSASEPPGELASKTNPEDEHAASKTEDDERDRGRPPWTPIPMPLESHVRGSSSNMLVGCSDDTTGDGISSSARTHHAMFDMWKGAHDEMANRYVQHTFRRNAGSARLELRTDP
jgi:hypothetical protein